MFLPPITRAEITASTAQVERGAAYLDRLAARSRLLPDADHRETLTEEVVVSLNLCRSSLHAVASAQVTAQQVEMLYTGMQDLGHRLGALRLVIEKAEQEQQLAGTVLPLPAPVADRLSALVITPAQLDAYQQMLDRASASLDRLMARSQALPDHAARRDMLAEIQAIVTVTHQLFQQVRHHPSHHEVSERWATSVKHLGTCLARFRLAVIQSEMAQPHP